MVVLSLIISAFITFAITWLFTKLEVFDFIGEVVFNLGRFAFFRHLIIIVLFFVVYCIASAVVEDKLQEAGNKIEMSWNKAVLEHKQKKEAVALKRDFTSIYLTAKNDLGQYDKIVKAPYGKETGTIQTDDVIKVVALKKTKNLTWLEAYALEDDTTKHIFALIPALISDVREECEYFVFRPESTEFEIYYKRIDSKNEEIRKKIIDDFSSELKDGGIEIEHSTDNVLRESIKNTHYIIPAEGYFGRYRTVAETEFYYVDKKQKKALDKIVKKANKRLKTEIITYF